MNTATTSLHALLAWTGHNPAAPLATAAALICANIVAQVRRPDRHEPEPQPQPTPLMLMEWMAEWGRSWDSATPPAGNNVVAVSSPPPLNLDAYTDDQLFMSAADPAPVEAKRLSWLRAHTLWLWHTPPIIELAGDERHEQSLSALLSGGIAGRHKPPRWRTRLNRWLHAWWTTTTPRDVDTRVRHAQTQATPSTAVRWRQATPRAWVSEPVAPHEVDISRSPQAQLLRLATNWRQDVPDATAGAFFADDTAVLQGAT